MWFRGGLVFKADRLFYKPTLGSGIMKKKKKTCAMRATYVARMCSGEDVKGSGRDRDRSRTEAEVERMSRAAAETDRYRTETETETDTGQRQRQRQRQDKGSDRDLYMRPCSHAALVVMRAPTPALESTNAPKPIYNGNQMFTCLFDLMLGLFSFCRI